MIRGAIVDLDGTVYTGDRLLPGAADGVEALREAGVSPLFLSNNPTRDGAAFAERLAGMGIDAGPAQVCSAADVTVEYLASEHDGESVYLLGSDSLASILGERGVELVDDAAAADVFLVSWTDAFDYADMQTAVDGLDADTAFLATDPDRTYPVDGGRLVPGTGAIAGAIAAAVGRDPDLVLGKPSQPTLDVALDRLGIPGSDCLVVGDRLNTELAMGERAGMTTVLVLTGIADRSDVTEADLEPDYVIDSLGEIGTVLDDLMP